ncbi:glycosyltransferase [Sulfurimonas sp. C5]|uniref:glycosyltransferase family 2 protein n=1 Tax=Sulfurimonas sp. C5 TaxID=3036947 RepID=UPI002454F4A0|nr:glycosyltransferase [Sulfurimonas sp. C5]MDH4943491.1 glycosyltransferase [Sulfurimonas sp. C5]
MEITVVIPTFNRYELLKRAVQSVLQQTFQAKEIIVVDDGSTDDTSRIQNDFPQIKYIYQENKGVSSARNLGIQHAVYDWIAFLDSDDRFVEEKLEKQVDFHQSNLDCLVSYTDEIWIRNNQEIKIPKKFQKIGQHVFEENIAYCNIAPSSVLIHKNVFEKVGYFDEALEVCEDYDLWLRISLQFQIALVNEKLIRKYAGHDDQLSFKHWGMDRFRIATLEKLLHLTTDQKKIEKINHELLKKYQLLLKGAIKYDKIHNISIYRKKLEQLNKRD